MALPPSFITSTPTSEATAFWETTIPCLVRVGTLPAQTEAATAEPTRNTAADRLPKPFIQDALPAAEPQATARSRYACRISRLSRILFHTM